MSLRTKILLGFGSILALVMVVWMWAILHLQRLGSAGDAILQENYRSILAAENMLGNLERQDSALLLYLLGAGEDTLTQFQAGEVEFLQWLGRAQDNITVAGEAQILLEIEADYTRYLAAVSELEAAQNAPDGMAGRTALARYQATVLPLFTRVRDQIVELRELNREAMVAASQRAQALARRAVWSMVTVGLVVSALGLALSLWFSRFLTRPLQAMTAAAGRIAEGDYEVELATASNDELGQLARAITTMSVKLKTFHRLNVGQIFAEKRRSEAIINSIADGLLVVDADLNVIALNPRAAGVFGVRPEMARGQHVFDVVQDRRLYEHIKTATHTGHAPELAEDEAYLTVTHNEHADHFRFAVTPIKSDHHDLVGVVLLLQDVTKLRELDRLKSDFVMTASHELRTPLTAMSMSLGLLTERATAKLDAAEQELLAAAEEEVTRLRALADNLLDLSKIETGHMDFEFEPAPVRLLVEQAAALFEAQAAAAGITLAATVAEPDMPVRADANKIAWVLSNLIGNALRYTERGGHITVSATRHGASVFVAVADNGTGIPLEYHSRIFDKFVQARPGDTAHGTGLGLAICKEVVKAHGGAIWLESTPGQGSTFTFSLPVAAVAPAPAIGDPNGTETLAHSHRG
jgi:NtrC-family two-component system sensor histidine kinase KinB